MTEPPPFHDGHFPSFSAARRPPEAPASCFQAPDASFPSRQLEMNLFLRRRRPLQSPMDAHRQPGASCLAVALCALASLGGVSIGFDFGVSPHVVRMDSFLASFCVGYDKNTLETCRFPDDNPESWESLMALYHVMYCFGYVCGSLLGGWVVDRWGRRKGIFVGALVYCCATMCVVLSQPHNYVMVLAARFIQGIGSGKYSVAVLAYAVEIAPKTQRGLFAGLTPLAAASGFFLAPTLAQVAREFGDAKEIPSDEIGWKLAVFFAILPQLFVAAGALFLPESPRWAYRHKGRLAAAVILHLLQPETVITAELNLIDDEVTRETQRNGHLQASSSLGDLWRAAHVRRRIVIVMAMQVLQQAIAASTVLSLAGLIFEVQAKESQSGEPSGVDITQALAGIALLVIFPALGLIEILGRRLMLLIGAAGTFFALFGAGLVLELGCDGATVESMTCTTFAKDCFIVSMAFGVGMSAMSWGLVCWTYSAEVFGFCVRARAISMAVVATWLMAAAMVFSATYNRKKHASTEFFLLACASIVAGLVAYFWCVETKGVELEMVEALFCQHVPARGAAEVKSADIPTPSVAESDAPYRMESVSSSIDKMPHLI